MQQLKFADEIKQIPFLRLCMFLIAGIICQSNYPMPLPYLISLFSVFFATTIFTNTFFRGYMTNVFVGILLYNTLFILGCSINSVKQE